MSVIVLKWKHLFVEKVAQILVRYGIKSISCNRDAIETISTTVFEEEQRLDKTKEKVG